MQIILIANLILFTFSAGALFYVLKYRIHIYATYELRDRPVRKRVTRPVTREVPDTEELVQTLVRLGAKPKVAQAAAIRAFESSPDQDFDHVLRFAIQECQRKK